ncbi:MAG: HD domain-containing protein [Firmicutes bacterium]|nr:HD domain-containing protein [Bacillota bacterium]
MVEIRVSGYVAEVIAALRAAGHETYVVGGCLRDQLLERPPRDWDLATAAPVAELKELLAEFKVVPTGLKFGTVTVLHPSGQLEISSFRAPSLAADLAFRDFTVNAMAWSEEAGLLDPWGGLADLEARVLRLTGGAKRLEEDPLRMLRAVRLAVELNFALAYETRVALGRYRQRIGEVSPERIRDELNKILLSPRPLRGVEYLRLTGLLRQILPEVDACIGFQQYHPAHSEDVYGHTLLAVARTPADLVVRWATLLHDIAKPLTFSRDEKGVGHFYGHEKLGTQIAGKILRRLRFDNKTISRVKTLVRNHMLAINYPEMRPGRLLARVGRENIDALFALQRADMQATAVDHSVEKLDAMAARVQAFFAQNAPVSRHDLAIDGRDLLAAGIPEGPELGRILAQLTEAVLDNPGLNQREQLLNMARELHKN